MVRVRGADGAKREDIYIYVHAAIHAGSYK